VSEFDTKQSVAPHTRQGGLRDRVPEWVRRQARRPTKVLGRLRRLRWWDVTAFFARQSQRLHGRRLRLALILALLLVVLNSTLAVWNILVVRDRDDWVSHSNTVMAQLDDVQADMSTMAATARGYVISGQNSFLQAYTLARTSTQQELTRLKSLTSDNALEQRRIAQQLSPEIDAEIATFQQAIALWQSGQANQALTLVTSPATSLSTIPARSTIGQMIETEQRLLTSRDAEAKAAFRTATVTVVLASLLDLLLLSIVYVLIRHEMAWREKLASERANLESRVQVLALLTLNQRLNEFVSIAGHELRTPLASALINIQLAERQAAKLAKRSSTPNGEGGDVERLSRLLQSTERQLQRQRRLISDMLDLSRLQEGKLEVERHKVDLVALVQESVQEQRVLQPERTITLALPGHDTQLCVLADADRLSQVVTNLLSNALKYSPEQKPVAVSLELRNERARVGVHDEGVGLTAKQREHIWEQFYRAPGVEVQSGSAVGLGLGLYITREIVERHEGEVGIVSKRGKGSTFWFELPLAHEDGRE
jgi:signal transduction histidine kinase